MKNATTNKGASNGALSPDLLRELLSDAGGYCLNAAGILRAALRGEQWALKIASQNIDGIEEYGRELFNATDHPDPTPN